MLSFNAFAFERTLNCRVSRHTEAVDFTENDGKSELSSKTFTVAKITKLAAYGLDFNSGLGSLDFDSTDYRVTISLDDRTVKVRTIINEVSGFEETLIVESTEKFMADFKIPKKFRAGKTEKEDGTFEKIECTLF